MTVDLYPIALILWLLLALWIARSSWKRRNSGVGLLHTYLLMFFIEHWVVAFIYTLPWYVPQFDPVAVRAGFYESLIALVGLSVGAIIIGPAICRKLGDKSVPVSEIKPASVNETHTPTIVPWIYCIVGFASYFFILPFAQYVPTLDAFVSGLTEFILAGIIILYWVAYLHGRKVAQFVFLIPMILWPLVTMIKDGFLGFGVANLLIVLIFVIRTSGKLKRYVIPVLVLAYLGVSIFVTYFQSRAQIRDVVWYSQNTTISDRVSTITLLTQNFTPFNIYDKAQLTFLDNRFNQDDLTGTAIQRLDKGEIDYAYGTTIANAFLMLLPRAIWVDKPLVAGGSQQVTQYTGIYYAGTTVATGHVMELYINFGTAGVILGFILLGTLLTFLDFGAARVLRNKNWLAFALWFLPATNLLRPGDSLLFLVSGTVSVLLTIIVTNLMIKMFLQVGAAKSKPMFTNVKTIHQFMDGEIQ